MIEAAVAIVGISVDGLVVTARHSCNNLIKMAMEKLVIPNAKEFENIFAMADGLLEWVEITLGIAALDKADQETKAVGEDRLVNNQILYLVRQPADCFL